MTDSKLVKNTIYYSIGEILPRALSFILLPIYTTYLSPSDYGIVSYTQTVIMFLYVLGAFALNTYVLRFYFIHESDEERRVLIGSAQLTILLLNVVIILLAFLLMPKVISRFDIQVPWNPYFRLAFVINFLDCLSVIPMVVYRVRQEAIKFVILGLSKTFLTTALTLYFLAVEGRGLLGSFQAQLYVLIPYTFVYLGILQKYGCWCINWKYLKEGLKFSSPLVPGSICFILLSMSDRIILERNVGISELGIYNVACTMSFALNIVIQSGYKAIEPELFRRFGKEGFYEFIRKIQSVFFCVIYVSALGLSLFSQEVFYLMTSEAFHGGYLLVPALLVGVIMTGQNVIYGCVLQGEKRTKVLGLATVIGAIVSVAVNLLLVPIYGTYAAAVTAAISFMVMNTILFYEMTYPGKSMVYETILVLLVPAISYATFFIFRDWGMISFLSKVCAIIVYALLAMHFLKVDFHYIKSLVVRT